MKITKKDCTSKQKINIDNYLMKRNNIKIEYGRSRYQIMSEKDRQRLKEYQKKKLSWSKKISNKKSTFFSINSIKMEKKVLIFGKKKQLLKIHFIKVNNELILIK